MENARNEADLVMRDGHLQMAVQFGENPVFDRNSGSTLVYPNMLEVREYQKDIIMKAIRQNMMCVIPTGLGMLVVMYESSQARRLLQAS